MEFNMRSGVLGITVVAVVIGAAILLTTVLDVQEVEYEKTEFKYITDTTSLFDYDRTPQYMDYDLSKSYTNYYTDDSAPYLGGAVVLTTAGQYVYDGMEQDIISTGAVNTYKLNLEGNATYDGIIDTSDFGNDMSTPPGESRFAMASYGSTGTSGIGNFYSWYHFEDNHVENLATSLTDYSPGQFAQSTFLYHNNGDDNHTGALVHIWDAISSDPQKGRIIIEGTEDSGIHNRFFIGSKDDYILSRWDMVYGVAYCEKEYYDAVQVKPTYKGYDGTNEIVVTAPIAAHSCIIDMNTLTVSLYPDYIITENSAPTRTINLDDAIIIYGLSDGSDSRFSMGYDVPVHFNNYIEVYAYMDTSVGVRISKAAEGF